MICLLLASNRLYDSKNKHCLGKLFWTWERKMHPFATTFVNFAEPLMNLNVQTSPSCHAFCFCLLSNTIRRAGTHDVSLKEDAETGAARWQKMRDEGAQLQAKEAEEKRLTLLAARTLNVSDPSAAAAAVAAVSITQQVQQSISDNSDNNSDCNAADAINQMTPINLSTQIAQMCAAHVRNREIEHAALHEIMFTLDELSVASHKGDISDDDTIATTTATTATKGLANTDIDHALKRDHNSSNMVQQQNNSNFAKPVYKAVCNIIYC
jgi:hypothetical protein